MDGVIYFSDKNNLYCTCVVVTHNIFSKIRCTNANALVFLTIFFSLRLLKINLKKCQLILLYNTQKYLH